MALAVFVVFGLLSGMGGTPVIAALIAAASGQHEVAVGANDEHFRLVLSHDSRRPEGSVFHTHGLASQFAMLFGEEDTRSNGDHVLHFDRLGNGTRAAFRVSMGKPAEVPLIAEICRQESPIFTPVQQARGDGGKYRDYGLGIPVGRSTVRLI